LPPAGVVPGVAAPAGLVAVGPAGLAAVVGLPAGWVLLGAGEVFAGGVAFPAGWVGLAAAWVGITVGRSASLVSGGWISSQTARRVPKRRARSDPR
jgi:hypothetical protein